jgi:Carboxypeptidase regulatory-like domain
MLIFRPMLRIFFFSALAAALPTAWGQQPLGPATLEGAVVNRITGQALKNVHLALQPEDRATGAERSTSTSTNGTFRFSNVDAGRYLLFAERPGFESKYYTTSSLNAYQGTLLTISLGEARKDLSIKLNPYGALSGKVVDEDGEPLAHVSVQAMRHGYLRGKRQLIPAGQAMTDDLGEYRIFELPAGRYVVYAKAAGEALLIEQRPFSYVPAYYPNGEDTRSATEFPLAPGQVQQGVDFWLRRAPTFAIQGHIASSEGEHQGVMVYLLARASAGLAEKNPVPVVGGRFEIQAVLPGSYILAADQFGVSGGPVNSARVELEVRDQDIKGIALTLMRPGELSGKVQMESSKMAAIPALRGNRTLQVSLQRLDDETALVGGTADEAGKFSLRGVSPGLYKVLVNNLRDGLYVKSIRAGGYDVTETGLDYSRGILPGELAIVLSANGGTLKGTVLDQNGANPGGVQVLAIPASGARWLKTAVSDQGGRFEMKGLAPGDYRVFAFEDIEPGAAEDPDFMKRFTDKSKQVTIKELGTETVETTTISAALVREGE